MMRTLQRFKRLYDRYFGDPEIFARVHNVNHARKLGVKVGSNCRLYSSDFSTEPYLIQIGDDVTVTDNVKFITHDGAVSIFVKRMPNIDLFGSIRIEDNVFIGACSIILPGTHIGRNSIVGAGSVVKGTFVPDSVIAGVPAKRLFDVETYFAKNQAKFSQTRALDARQKREFLLGCFGESSGVKP